MTVNVGVVGVGSEGSWAREAHVPAVRAVKGLRLLAVSARDRTRAERVARDEGVDRAYGSTAQLIADPEVEVVVVGVPVPVHDEVIRQVLAAGKHVVTEWPLGVSTAQNQRLSAAIGATASVGVVDLQARHAPAVARARSRLRAGAIGSVESIHVLSTTAGWGATIPAAAEYLEDPDNGMNLATIQTAHTLDLLVHLAGPVRRMTVRGGVEHPEVRVAGTERVVRRRVPDHLDISATLASGAMAAVEMRAGRPVDDTPFHLRITGTSGEIELRGGSDRGFQAGVLALARDGAPIDVEDPFASLPAPVRNLAALYDALAAGLASGHPTTPTFAHATALGHLIDDVLTGLARGGVVDATPNWPRD